MASEQSRNTLKSVKPGVLPPPSSHIQTQYTVAWKRCNYCNQGDNSFRSPKAFCQHLRDFHSTREGGSYICHYGPNNVCPSLPVDGVSDRDYEDHVARDHVPSVQASTPLKMSASSSGTCFNSLIGSFRLITVFKSYIRLSTFVFWKLSFQEVILSLPFSINSCWHIGHLLFVNYTDYSHHGRSRIWCGLTYFSQYDVTETRPEWPSSYG